MTTGLTVNGYLDVLKSHFEKVFKTDLKLVKSVSIHRGRFTTDELKRVSVHAPSLHIALTGTELTSPWADGFGDYRMSIAVTIITKDIKNSPRETQAQNIISEMATSLPSTEFDFTEGMTNIRAQNLYSGDVDKQGVMLWSLTFNQLVRLGKHTVGHTGAVLDTVHGATENHGKKSSYHIVHQKTETES